MSAASASQGDDAEASGAAPVPMETVSPAPSPSKGGDRPSRLLITKIVMQNFKSYGGEREIGPFHKNLSSIVGPNGSGKSNVIDAMLFVFGKKAKKLRLNKVSELIHRSETFPNLDFTRVSVHFVDIVDDPTSEDGYEEVPGTRLVVTRAAYSNNTSKYQVDGKTATFGDVGLLLRRRGVDLDNNRFLILQGEVEQIAMMKPRAQAPHEEGLLEYLEDIIGSNRHVEATEAAAKEVEAQEEARGEKLQRLRLAEKEKEGLAGAKEEAEALLATEAGIRRRRSVHLQATAARAEAGATKAAADAETHRAQLVERSDALKAAEKRETDEQMRFEAAEGEYRGIMDERDRCKASFAEYERKDIKLAEDKKFLDTQLRKLRGAVDSNTKKQRQSEAKVKELEGSLPGLQRAVSQAARRKADEVAGLETVNAELRERTSDLRAQLDAAQAAAVPVRARADEIKNRLETARCEMALVEAPAAEAMKGLAAAEKAREAAAVEATRNLGALAAAETEAAELGAKVAAAAATLAEATEAEQTAAAAAARALAAAEEKKAAREAEAGRSGALRSLLAAVAPGGELAAAGVRVRGRLGDLGSIDDAYDVAVSTACAYLDHIVVDTAEDGARCVDYLRAKDAGRASFIILGQLGHLSKNMTRPFTSRGGSGCPRLFDLVRPAEPRYAPAFYLGLRDTLVAADLEAAVAVAYDGNRCVARVVTREGQLIDQSGAMSGGGGAARRGGMGSSAAAASAAAAGAAVSEREAAAAVEAATAAEAALREARAERKRRDEAARTLKRRGEELAVEVPKLSLEVAGASETDAQLAERAERLLRQCELSPEDKKKLAKLRKAAAADEELLKSLGKELSDAEAAVSALQAAILDAGGERLKRAAKATAAAAAALSSAQEEAATAEADAAAERKKAEKAGKEMAKREKELAEAEKKAKANAAAIVDMEEKATAVMKACEEAQTAAKEKKAQLDQLTAALEGGRTELKRLKAELADGSQALDDLLKRAKEGAAVAEHARADLAKLRKLHAEEFTEWGVRNGDDKEDEEDEGSEDGDDSEYARNRRGGGGDAAETNGGEAGPREAQQARMEDDGGVEETKGGETAPAGATAAAAAAAVDASGVATKKLAAAAARGGVLLDLEADVLAAVDCKALLREVNLLESERDKLRANVNMSALLEYRKKDTEYMRRAKELEEATLRRNDARRNHDELRRRRLEEFMAGFGAITLKLKEMYQMITLGGDAELELVDSLDPFSEGVVFSVRPPKKSWKNIANLSGGEKTLSSLALVFALHHYKPTPLYVMDEIDAALDFKNVSIVANYIKERTKDAQFIIISLRNNMFELADRLVGIYKTHNVTKSVTINPKKFSEALEGSGTTGSASPLGDRTNAAVEAA